MLEEHRVGGRASERVRGFSHPTVCQGHSDSGQQTSDIYIEEPVGVTPSSETVPVSDARPVDSFH
jgi:hypothetical protein